MFDDRPCGSGKTFGELQYMVQTAGRYLLAVDQRRTMREREREIRDLALKAGKKVPVVMIESGDSNSDFRSGTTTARTTTSVRTCVAAVPYAHDLSHIIVVVTHEAVKLADLAAFSGWNLVIDETPSILDQQSLQTTISREMFERHYELHRRGKRSEIVSKSRATAADMRRDSLTSPITVMHQRVVSDRTIVLTDVGSWDELREAGEWTWASIWSPESLAVFDSVLILANAFTRSLTYAILSRMWPEIKWVPHQRLALRQYRRRSMTIRYFAERHTASRSLFNSDIGKERLAVIAKWIADNAPPVGHIWTCNLADRATLSGHLVGYEWLPPRQAGSNSFADRTCVTTLYTAKPSPIERTLFRDLDVDPRAATESREFETLYQFACRCAVRDPRSDAALTIHVYDRAQAQYLHDLFVASEYVDSTMELVDLGFAQSPPPLGQKPGPKPKLQTAEEKSEKKQRDRELSRERQRRRRARTNSGTSPKPTKPIGTKKRPYGSR